MKTNWQTRKLSDVLVKTETINPLLSPNTGFAYIDVSSVSNETFTIENTTKILGKDAPSRARKKIKAGDIIFATVRPTLKRIAIVPKELDGQVCSTGYFVLRVSEKILNRLVYYYLLSDDFSDMMEKLQKGASYPAVTDGNVKHQLISFPESLSEQKRIVKTLDDVFEKLAKAKENAEKNLQNSKELFESYLQSVFANPGNDWEEKKLGSITSKIGSGATPRGGKGSYHKEGISLVRSMNVHDRKFTERNLAFIDDKQASDLSNVTLEKDDVLLNITGASVARCCIFPEEYLPARVNQHVSIIRSKPEIIDSYFLNYLLTTKNYKDQLLGIGEQGATRQAITKAQLEEFVVLFPKVLSEQKSIVKKLDAISTETKKLEKIYEQKLADLEELKKSVLRKAFAGEL